MTPRELVIRSLNHEPVERVPRDLFDGLGHARTDDRAEIHLRFPADIQRLQSKFLPGKRLQGKSGRGATFTDAWGCSWKTAEKGFEPVESPLADSAQIAGFEPPADLLDKGTITKANRACESTTRFVLAESQARPFDRLLWLRGRQAGLSDLARGTKRIRTLLERLHDSFRQELQRWAESEVDGVLLGDDFAGEEGLLVDPEVWRDLFGPLYRDYCNILHNHDKFAFFQSAGKLSQVFGTLVRSGVDAVYSPWLPADVRRLAHRYRGKVTFWIGIEPEHEQPESTPDEVRESVLQVRKALDFGSGGVIAVGRFQAETPLRNISALYEQWLMPLPMHAG